jgi:ABC-type nitrate/sulfonate/bicarbonate transport system substrate-binding protein
MMRVRLIITLLVLALLACRRTTPATETSPGNASKRAKTKVVVNEAVRTMIYLPLYHAADSGCFAREHLDVSIITGGTATNSFAALLS